MYKLLDSCVITCCGECKHYCIMKSCYKQPSGYKDKPFMLVNPDTIDLSCPLQEVEVYTPIKMGTLTELWNKFRDEAGSIDSIIIVKKRVIE